MTRREQISYLAVALSDKDLDLIAGTDALINLSTEHSSQKILNQTLCAHRAQAHPIYDQVVL
eukprot:8615884-Ditylum_brightwellii.AAC.1